MSRPIVEAIYGFRMARGLWPQRLDDLPPEFLASTPAKTWEYRWDPEGESNLRCPIAEGPDGEPQFLAYVFGGDDEGWHVGRPGAFRGLPAALPSRPHSVRSAKERLEAMLAEFDRRIEREPNEQIHRRGKITLLFRSKEYEAAKTVCVEWTRADPFAWRPRWAFLDIERMRLAGIMDDEAERKWSQSTHPTLARWRLFNSPGHNSGALEALPAALELPAVKSGDEWLVAEIAYLDAIDRATRQEKFNRVVEICDIWEANAARHEGAIIQDWLYFRAAARLTLGDFDGARGDAEKASESDRAGRISNRGVGALVRAIHGKDTSYRPAEFDYDALWRLDVR